MSNTQYPPVKNWNELRKYARQYSEQNPKLYVMATAIFGEAQVWTVKRPTWRMVADSPLKGYWLGGKFRTFTDKAQKKYSNWQPGCPQD